MNGEYDCMTSKRINSDLSYKYLTNLLYLTIGFGVIIAAFLIASEYSNGWAGLTYILYGMITAALWALVSVIYLISVIASRSRRNPAIPILFIIGLIALCATFLGLADY